MNILKYILLLILLIPITYAQVNVHPKDFIDNIHANIIITVKNESLNIGDTIRIVIQRAGVYPESDSVEGSGTIFSILPILPDVLMDFEDELVPDPVPQGTVPLGWYVTFTSGGESGNTYSIATSGNDASWSGEYDYFGLGESAPLMGATDTFNVVYRNSSVVLNNTYSVHTDGYYEIQYTPDYYPGTWIITTNVSGVEESTTFEMGKYNIIETNSTDEIGLNHVITYTAYYEKEGNASLRGYDYLFQGDDLGSLASSCGVIDLDNDGTNEMVCPDYNGYMRVYNWSGISNGRIEGKSTDQGTFHLSGTDLMFNINNDNDGDGCPEISGMPYDVGRIKVIEFCNGTWDYIFTESADRGTYRSPATWCDIDNDGDDDLWACTYEGVCRLYMYAGGTYVLNYTGPDDGSYNYHNNDVCGDLRNEGKNYIFNCPYEGDCSLINMTDGAVSILWTDTDRGSYYVPPTKGKFILNDNDTYIIIGTTSGIDFAFNCSIGGATPCVFMDSGADIGSTYYGAGVGQVEFYSDRYNLFYMDTSAEPQRAYMNTPTSMISTNLAPRLYGESYGKMGIPATDTLSAPNFLLYTNRYDSDVRIVERTALTTYTTRKNINNIEGRHYGKDYYYGFLYPGGITCGQLDTDSPEDECMGMTYGGIPYYFTYREMDEFRFTDKTPAGFQDFYNDPELIMLSNMPKDALMYFIGNRTYCVNENDNVLLDGQTKGWIKIFDDEGIVLPSSERVTDGILSTDILKGYQTSSDYTTFDAGVDQSMRMNITRTIDLGEIKLWSRFEEEYNMQDLSIELSEETCTHPDTNTYTVVYENDTHGASTYQGYRFKFKPQRVGCIRINASGIRYSETSYSTTNYVSEVAGFYGNNCTFTFMPSIGNGADINKNYNISAEIMYGRYEDSPNVIDGDYQGTMSTFDYFIKTINRVITWLNLY